MAFSRVIGTEVIEDLAEYVGSDTSGPSATAAPTLKSGRVLAASAL